MKGWKSYLGLPHAFGADPENGQGADCLIMAFHVLDELRLPHPEFDTNWIELAASGNWKELLRLWNHHTTAVDSPENGDLTIFSNDAGLGLGVAIDGGLLLVHHLRGVCWVPLEHIRPLVFRRFHL